MFEVWSGVGDLGQETWQQQGYASRAAWKAAGKPGAPPPIPIGGGSSGGGTLTVPTTEPNQCPPGMTYSAPSPGSGTGSCSGPNQIGPGAVASGAGAAASPSGSSLTDMIAGIPSTYLLIGGALILFMVLKK